MIKLSWFSKLSLKKRFPRLYYLQSLDVIESNRPEKYSKNFPDLCIILDGLPFSVDDSGLYFEHQFNYSAYKHEKVALIVLRIRQDGLVQLRSPAMVGSSSETNNALTAGNIVDLIVNGIVQERY